MSSEIFKLGDEVWLASWESVRRLINCPDCHGREYLTVILGDDTQVTIACTSCCRGYDPPTGSISQVSSEATTRKVRITCVTLAEDRPVEYRFDGGYHVGPDRLFREEAEARAAARVLGAEAAKEENTRLYRKDKQNHTWAWHVTYHRQQMKQAQKDLAYHTAKLAAAQSLT